VLLFAACNSATQDARLTAPAFDTLASGTIVVTNSGPTAWADTNGWKLVLEHTVQPPEGDPAAFGDPFDILPRPDGTFLLRESDDPTLSLYAADGRVIRRFGRDGAGPGEFRHPYPAWLGDTLVVHDPAQSRITFYALDGTLLRSFPSVCCHEGPPITVDARGWTRVTGQRPSDSAFTMQWIWFDRDGNRVDSLIPPTAGQMKYWTVEVKGGRSRYNVPFAGQNSYAFLPDSGVVYGFTDRYELLVSPTGRDTSRIIRRTGVVGDPVRAGMVDSIIAFRVKYNAALGPIAKASDAPSVHPLWTDVSIDGAGNLWVHRGDNDGGRRRFDVFDPEGRFLGEVASPFPKLWTSNWAGDRVAVLDEDEAGLPRVRIYRIERQGDDDR
jgi:hypothetical protein